MFNRNRNRNRKTIRLPGYDYKSNGYYFVTFCTQNRLTLFGNIKNGKMHLNDAGRMVHAKIANLSRYYPGVFIDSLIVMPDHVHVVIVLRQTRRFRERAMGHTILGRTHFSERALGSAGSKGQTQRSAPTATYLGLSDVIGNTQQRIMSGFSARLGLSDVIRNIKTYTTTCYIHGVRNERWKPFCKRLWQRGYYERIIRNSNALNIVQKYIMNNPIKHHLKTKKNKKSWRNNNIDR